MVFKEETVLSGLKSMHFLNSFTDVVIEIAVVC